MLWVGFALSLYCTLEKGLLCVCEFFHFQIDQAQVKFHLVHKQFLLIVFLLKLRVIMVHFTLVLILKVGLLNSNTVVYLNARLLVSLQVEQNAKTKHVVLDLLENLAVGV